MFDELWAAVVGENGGIRYQAPFTGQQGPCTGSLVWRGKSMASEVSPRTSPSLGACAQAGP